MKKILYAVMLLLGLSMMASCGGGSDVSSLYGTYEGRDAHGNTVSITLKPDSDNEWRKFGEDHSSNLGHVDSKGRFKSSDWQSIKWTSKIRKSIIHCIAMEIGLMEKTASHTHFINESFHNP